MQNKAQAEKAVDYRNPDYYWNRELSWLQFNRRCLGEARSRENPLMERLNFLSITVDDPGNLSDAKAILEENGCTFPCLDGQGSAGLMGGFLSRVMAIPTTLFLDSRGNEVGDWMLGVPQTGSSVTDAYLSEIQARLSQLSGK